MKNLRNILILIMLVTLSFGIVSVVGCNKNEPEFYTEGLVFELSEDQSYYLVTGYTGEDLNIVIPNVYNKKPVKIIKENAFYNKNKITKVTIPKSVTTIQKSAFYQCLKLSKVYFSQGLKEIGENAFYGCKSITRLVFPKSLGQIGANAFQDCTELQSVSIKEEGDILATETTQIGMRAFYRCIKLVSIQLPASTREICAEAFRDCLKLSQVKLNEGLQVIGRYAFFGCSSLFSIEIPSTVTEVQVEAFTDCYRLVEICNKSNLQLVVGDTANGGIAKNALNIYVEGNSKIAKTQGYVYLVDGQDKILINYCGAETRIYLPSFITKINKNALKDKTALTFVLVGDNVTEIGASAFANCYNLSSIFLSSGLKDIGSYAFSACRSITTISIPATVENIGKKVFYACTTLGKVYLENCEGWNYVKSDGTLVEIPFEELYISSYAKESFDLYNGSYPWVRI